MPRTSQALLKQHDRKYTDIKTIIEQQRILKGTILSYNSTIEKQLKAYYDWCKKNDIEAENIVLPKLDLKLSKK